MPDARIKVSGNHINELSENIPSNIFALNELIKNSYDACATYCEIEINAEKLYISVTDNGKGLNESSINELFHLSRSSKKFGSLNECDGSRRRVQGSKGLGFLAAFRFGDYVTWDTACSGKRYVFSADKKELTSQEDISAHTITIERSESSSKGTSITINSDTPTISELIAYFSNGTNHLKLVGAILDKGFEIKLKIGKSTYRTSSIPELKDLNPSDQLFYVRYSSVTKDVEIFRNGYLEKTVKVGLSSDEYEVYLDLMIYSLESHGRKKISPYFYRPNDSAITPLTFINDNLFNNYDIFDTDIFRSRRSKSSLPQIIGYVKVYSESELFEFNSDRTNFVENSVTNALVSDLLNLNEKIQSVGSELKSIAKSDNRKYTGPAFPKGGASGSRKPLVKAKIETPVKERKITVPSEQINLLDYVTAVADSNGNPVAIGDLDVFVDNKQINDIMSSITEPCKKIVTYKFNDPNTGDVVEKIELNFVEKRASITGDGSAQDLFYISGSSKNYSIKLKNVAKLMEQISDANKKGRYSFLIACSLRTIFELSSGVVQIDRPKVFTHDFIGMKRTGYGSTDKVVQVIHFLKNNNKVTTAIAKELGLSFMNLKRILNVELFKQNFEYSNVGAHSGDQYLTASLIQDIAKFAGFYAALCDALVYKVDEQLIENSSIVDL